jgi:enamine deaminase RidA (YjgF/YER057c/UK114 family)
VTFEIFNPESLGAPRGWNHGMLAPAGGRVLFVAGQIGLETGEPGGAPTASRGFAEQFGVALDHVLAVIRAAGGGPGDLARMTVFVTDLAAYRAARPALGEAWRARFGRHYPAMALVEVRGLVDAGALVEIEATAVLPPAREQARGGTKA